MYSYKGRMKKGDSEIEMRRASRSTIRRILDFLVRIERTGDRDACWRALQGCRAM